MENVEPKIELSAIEFIRAMQEGVATDVNGKEHSFDCVTFYRIQNILVKEKIHQTGLTFKQDLFLISCKFDAIIFHACSFEKELRISDSIINSYFTFSDSVFSEGLYISSSTILESGLWERNKIKADFRLHDIMLTQGLTLSANEIEGAVFLIKIVTELNLNIVSGSIGNDLRVHDSKVGNLFTINGMTITGAVVLDNTIADKLQFLSTPFSLKSFEIAGGAYQKIVLPTSIPEKISLKIIGIRFKTIDTVHRFTNLGYMQWNKMQPLEGAVIKLHNSVMGKWDIVNCDFEQTRMEIYSSKITDAFYTNTKFPKKLSVPKDREGTAEEHDILRDGYNQLKTLAQKQNDRKTFLHYQAAELRSYKKTLSWSRDFATNFQLLFMWLSNDYGTRWYVGVLFTIVFNYIFLAIAFAFRPLDCSKWDSFLIKGIPFFANFTNPPAFLSGDWEKNWFYVGHIVIIFGVYQTISAFRKFGKGES